MSENGQRPKTCIEFHTGYYALEKKKFHQDKDPEDMHVYDCPFCGKGGHLYYFPANTAWDCKACGKRGNVHSFNQMFYNEVCTRAVEPLVQDFGLPRRVFDQVRYNPLTGDFVFPTFRNDRLNNLYKYVKSLNRFMGTPGLPATLYDWSDDSYDEIWICEGQKDKLAAMAIIGSKEVTPIGIPGANMFREAWTGALQGKKVVLVFDHDKAGLEGKTRTLDILKKSMLKPKEVHFVNWPPDKPNGYDLRDFYLENKGKSWSQLQLYIEKVNDDDVTKVTTETIIEDPSCDSYDKALHQFADAFYMTPDMTTALAMVMATIYSIKVEGEQLWLKVIGPPGCGKTRIAKAVSASDHVINKSTFTGLFSGWKDTDDKDAGLIPIIQGRTLIVKDADALLRQKNIEQIMSELRDFYDKDSAVQYRNRVSYNYQNIKSTFIMLGTQVLRRADHSFLGERLLSLEMDVSEIDKDHISKKMMERSLQVALGRKDDPETAIMASMKGWINHLKERELDSTLPQEFQDAIIQMCSLTANMRTQVDRDWKGKLQSPAVPELPTRLIGQIVTASLSLCAVFGQNKPNEEIYRIIKKVLKDTINPRSHRFLICDVIVENPSITALELMEATGLDKAIIGEELMDLVELSFVQIHKVAGSRPGFKVPGYVLHPRIKDSFKMITSQ